MWQSLRISHLVLRLFLAIVFLWAGIDIFFHQAYWLQSNLPHIANFLHLAPESFMYFLGSLEILIGISLVSNMFTDIFATLGLVLFIIIASAYGFNEATIGYVGLFGGLLALLFWPHRQFRNL